MPGCSVVPPISVSRPDSTCGSSASCWVLLNEWISSTKTTVERPSRSSASWASSIAARMSLMPASTAEIAMKWLLVTLAASRPSVVLPTPGGPHRMNECSLRDSNASRSGLPGPSRWRWPTTSSSVCGRISSASGGTGLVEKRSAMVCLRSYSDRGRRLDRTRRRGACAIPELAGSRRSFRAFGGPPRRHTAWHRRGPAACQANETPSRSKEPFRP